MSTYIIPMFIQGYEDYEKYEQCGNAFAGWPDMWPEERYAEGGLWRERKAMMEQIRMYSRFNETYTPSAESTQATDGTLSILERALISIAKENEWKIKNQDAIEHYNCSPVFEIPPCNENEDPMPDDWYEAVRWLDRQKTKREQWLAEEGIKKAERDEKRRRDNRITLDAALLKNIIGDMMPGLFMDEGGKNVAFVKRAPHSRIELQEIACAMLAEDNGWKMNDPCGGKIRIYKTA